MTITARGGSALSPCANLEMLGAELMNAGMQETEQVVDRWVSGSVVAVLRPPADGLTSGIAFGMNIEGCVNGLVVGSEATASVAEAAGPE